MRISVYETQPRTEPHHLRLEHLDEPLGITEHAPRLSWWLPANARRQLAYRVRVEAPATGEAKWDSGRVASDRSVLVPYAGPPLRACERLSWKVKVWTDAGESGWSEPAWWEMGLLHAGDWVARWIEPAEPDEARSRTARPAQLLRGTFTYEASLERARLYVTAHGIYEFFINGARVGDMELTPGFTSYQANLQVQTFDVTELVIRGQNAMGAIVSDGWFRGQNGAWRFSDLYGDTVALLAQLHLHDADGSLTRVGTGADWLAGTGSIVAADLIEGQAVDLREDVASWCTPDARPSGWAPVRVRDHDLGRPRSSPAPPVRRIEELRPITVTRLSGDRQIVDLGQNINGWVRLTKPGPPGATVALSHGEALDADGDVTVEHLVMSPVEGANVHRPFQVDRVIFSGAREESFEPRHTTHGFRYVRVEGHGGGLGQDDIAGVVVHTDLRRTGWFECSDERINRLHQAAVWSFRGNACDIPTDCPTRERAGWTGDWQLFVPTAAFLYDVAGFSVKWLRDLAAEQRADGAVMQYVPDVTPGELARFTAPPASAGWGDAAVIVPWEIYLAYGDTRVLEEQWDSMVSWVEFAARAARTRRHASRIAARPVAAPHETALWDTGFHFGEWMEPDEFANDDFGESVEARAGADYGDVATAYLHRSSRLLAQVAGILGRDQDAARYDDLATATRAAWQAEFIRPDGSLARDTQASYVRALAFGLLPEELMDESARRLVELVRAAGTHIGTGFLATPYLLPVLTDMGHADIAYELLFQDSEPSWLTMVDRGATTIWEAWNGIDESGRPHFSLNHYSKGAVVSYLHRYVAGIRLDDDVPAYRRFRIAPVPGRGISWARAAHDSPFGRIESSWRVEGDRFSLDVRVPQGTSAEICLPDGRRFSAGPGDVRTTA